MRSSSYSPDSPEAKTRIGPLPLAALAATLALVAIASFMPERRLWGFNHLAFYPLYIRVPVLIVAALAFLPAVSRRVLDLLTRVAGCLTENKALGKAAAAAAAVLAAAVFWFLRSSTLLLGDARLVASNFEHAFDPDYVLIVSSPRIILSHEPIARGTSLLYHYAARFSREVVGAEAVQGIQAVNCLLGAALVFVLLRALNRGRMTAALAVWSIFLVLSSGAMQLYFGYVENYTPLLFFGSLYVLTAIGFIRRRDRNMMVPVLACLILAVFMHIQGILLAPSFVFLVVWYSRPNCNTGLSYITALVAGLTAAGALLLATATGYGRHFLPLFANDEIFGVLSPSHLADIASQILLVFPTALVACAIVLSSRRRTAGPRSAKTEASSPAGRREAYEGGAMLHFMLLILIPCMIFLLVFKPDLGMARDWDLFAIAALGLIPPGLLHIGRALGRGKGNEVRMLTAPALVLSIALAAAWIGINSDRDRSARRFEAILEYDLTRAPYAFEVLAQHYRNGGDLDRAIDTMERGIARSYNTRLMALAADLYEERGKPDDAIRLRLEVLGKQPRYEGTRRDLVLQLHRLGRYDELLEIAREGTEFHYEKPIYHYFYGKALINAERIEEAIEQLIICRSQRPGPDVTADIDRMLARLEAMGYDIEGRVPATRVQIPGR